MYYNLYHASDLREIVRFLRQIECIEFERNAFVLVLVQIDLIHFEHTKGVVQAWVGQKRLNYYILSFFCDVR